MKTLLVIIACWAFLPWYDAALVTAILWFVSIVMLRARTGRY